MGRRKNRRALLIVAAIVAIVVVHDVAVANHRGLAARAALFAIDEYRAHISPRLAGKVTCRFEPTCSAYGRAAIAKYGFAIGSAKTALRLARCAPWTPAGTVDPP